MNTSRLRETPSEEHPTMSTDRQIESNRLNALLSTGPRTPEGKAKSRANALKHGMAAETLLIDGLHDDFAERKAEWEADIKPTTPEACFALDAVVACTFRIEECRRNINGRIEHDITRACLVWDVDREADAALVASKLAKQPALVSRQLQSSKQGVELLLRTWNLLNEALDARKGAWSDAQISTAFDLLGIPGHLRDGRAPFDPPQAGADVYEYRRAFIFREVERLQARQEGLSRVDLTDREHAETGASVLGTKPVTLLLRYENAAWRRYDTMLKAAKAGVPQEASVPEPEPETRLTEFDVDMAALSEAETETSPLEYAVPNEPNSEPALARNLNRHQRRKQASKARRG
jgi:hypothetical protein